MLILNVILMVNETNKHQGTNLGVLFNNNILLFLMKTVTNKPLYKEKLTHKLITLLR